MSVPALLGVLALDEAVKCELELSDHLLLIYLANFHNQKQEGRAKVKKSCYPSMETIRIKSGLSDGQVPVSLRRLETLGLITKLVGEGKGRGTGRRTNLYVLNFAFIYERDDSAFTGEFSAEPAPPIPQSLPPEKKGLKERNKTLVGLASDEVEEIAFSLWKAASDFSRKRSSKDSVKKAIEAAGKKGATREALLGGGLGYFLDRENGREEGKFQKAVHRVITSGVYIQFVDEGPKIAAKAAGDAPQAAKSADVGHKAPPISAAYQRRYMELDAQGMPWDIFIRGPRPGHPNCRISPALQIEFGYTPFGSTPAAEPTLLDLDDEVLD